MEGSVSLGQSPTSEFPREGVPVQRLTSLPYGRYLYLYTECTGYR